MTLKECCAVLGVTENAESAEIKRAYRRLAFSLHPDLNPDVPNASRRFKEVNEAYVVLRNFRAGAKNKGAAAGTGGAGVENEASASRASREEARRAYAKAGRAQDADTSEARRPADGGRRREDVLRDILNDPFARRVYEDIYRHIGKEKTSGENGAGTKAGGEAEAGTSRDKAESAAYTRATPEKPRSRAGARKQKARFAQPGVIDKVKGWFLKYIDEEQVLRLPGRSLVPGAHVRLEIQHGFTEDPQIVEITLPPEFIPGKSMRLKGMGRRIGNLRGDLYVRIEAE
ncbi:MAG: DnaJ domain-containing protein [Desulfovibrio sp.]|jgi:molecular chaperone DnaJ|nr:DnaJ domain-containing protein [Desulfovibrio sp.]